MSPTPGAGGGAAGGTGIGGTAGGQGGTTNSTNTTTENKDNGMMGAVIATSLGVLLVLVAGGIGGWNLYSNRKRKLGLVDATPLPPTQGNWGQAAMPSAADYSAPYDQQNAGGWQANAVPAPQLAFNNYNQAQDYNGYNNYNQSADYNGPNNYNAAADYNGQNNYNPSSDYNGPNNYDQADYTVPNSYNPAADYNGYSQAPSYGGYEVPMTPPLGSPVPTSLPGTPPPEYRQRDEYATAYVNEALPQQEFPQAPMQSGDTYGQPPNAPQPSLSGTATDPFLRAMMRQAQVGLFALPDQESA